MISHVILKHTSLCRRPRRDHLVCVPIPTTAGYRNPRLGNDPRVAGVYSLAPHAYYTRRKRDRRG